MTADRLRVLGVDPGSSVTGWGLLTGTRSRLVLAECGVIRLRQAGSFEKRLASLSREMQQLIEQLAPTSAAVESAFRGKSTRSALQLAHARGVILAALAGSEVDLAEYTPATVKKSVTGNGNAEKDQVRRMMVHLLGAGLADKPDDLTDALAVAWCHVMTSGFAGAVRRSAATQPEVRRQVRVPDERSSTS